MKAYVALFVIGACSAGIDSLYINNNCEGDFSGTNYNLEKTCTEFRLLFEKQLDFCQSPEESADISSLINLLIARENLVAANDKKGFMGNQLEIINQLQKLQYDKYSEVQKQSIALVLEESTVTYNLLYYNLATLYDVTYNFEHIYDIYLQGLKIDYNDNF